jgi:DNA-binding CsgD family transcriptional regulator
MGTAKGPKGTKAAKATKSRAKGNRDGIAPNATPGTNQMFLTKRQREVLRWYWCDGHTLEQIAEWLDCSYSMAAQAVRELRLIFASHGKDLPRFNRGRPRIAPDVRALAA